MSQPVQMEKKLVEDVAVSREGALTWKHFGQGAVFVAVSGLAMMIPALIYFNQVVPSKETVRSIAVDVGEMSHRMDVALEKIYSNDKDQEYLSSNLANIRRDVDKIFESLGTLIETLNNLTIELRTKGVPQ